ncbi:hypothetical protein BJ508DRAFT_334089 [Ascobolus immersus RN42]|uniref:Uncharacterized protein n=1 Tax=Ascobolus immersus RN42 TaxID=1160509 RepID=A0A3N4HHC3_ASCIM|nr:hypothetical protein BJ508DRAFT_334089 [Ascobolus immersus RN42]
MDSKAAAENEPDQPNSDAHENTTCSANDPTPPLTDLKDRHGWCPDLTSTKRRTPCRYYRTPDKLFINGYDSDYAHKTPRELANELRHARTTKQLQLARELAVNPRCQKLQYSFPDIFFTGHEKTGERQPCISYYIRRSSYELIIERQTELWISRDRLFRVLRFGNKFSFTDREGEPGSITRHTAVDGKNCYVLVCRNPWTRTRKQYWKLEMDGNEIRHGIGGLLARVQSTKPRDRPSREVQLHLASTFDPDMYEGPGLRDLILLIWMVSVWEKELKEVGDTGLGGVGNGFRVVRGVVADAFVDGIDALGGCFKTRKSKWP